MRSKFLKSLHMLGGKCFINHKLKYFCFYVTDWVLSSRRSNGTETGGRGGAERTLSLTGSPDGSSADHIASDHQQIHGRAPATKCVLQSYALQVKTK